MSRAYLVILPSCARGETEPLLVTGQLGRLRDLGDYTPAIRQADGTCVVLDPRAIVCDVGRQVWVYSPRAVPADELAPWVREWLAEHPRWGQPGCDQDWATAVRPAGDITEDGG